jgi:hypothetical protein
MHTFGWLFVFGLTGSTSSVINFDHAALGKTPSEWTILATDRGVNAHWEIRRDPSAPTQPYVFAQVSGDPRQDGFSLAILNTMSLRDGDISVRLKPVSGREDQGGGLVFRYRDEKNFYVVRANTYDDEVAVYKVENGRPIPIRPRGAPASVTGVKHDLRPNVWSILKVSVRGRRFQVYVNHHRILQAEDSNSSVAGKVGLATRADSVTYFDDFRVSAK